MLLTEGFDWSVREWTTKSIEEIIRNEYEKINSQGPFTYNEFICLNSYYNNNSIRLCLKQNGDIYFQLDFTFYGRSHFEVLSYTLSDKWYPFDMMPIYKFKLGNNNFDMSLLDTYIPTLSSDILIKKETVKLTAFDGTYNYQDFIVFYFDKTNVPIYTLSGIDHYDVSGWGLREYNMPNFKQKISVKKVIPISCEGDFKYYEYAEDSIYTYVTPSASSNHYAKFDTWHTGHAKYTGKLYYELRPYGSDVVYDPKVEYDSLRVTGNDPIKLTGIYTLGTGFIFSPYSTNQYGNNEFFLYSYNQTQQRLENWASYSPDVPTNITTPSEWQYGSGITAWTNVTLSNFAKKIETPLFTYDRDINRVTGNILSMPVFGISFGYTSGVSQLSSFDENIP